MKKLSIIASLFLITSIAFAQNPKVVNAFMFLNNGQLDKAKENIDAAVVHQQTANQAKTWLYKGNVYLAIALSKEEKFQNLHATPLDEAYDAYQKSIEIDAEYEQPSAFPSKAQVGLFIIGEQYYNKGVEYFYLNDFTKALNEFEKTKKINNIFGVKDSLATFNAVLCAIQLEDYDKSITYLRELITMNYNNPVIFSALANIYKDRGEFDRAKQVIRGGKTKYPNDLDIIIAETNIYLATGDIENAQKTLEVAIAQDPNNALLYFTVGSNYDQMSRAEELTDEQRLQFINEAEKAYMKAIGIKADYFDAYYNMGALFFNEGVRLFEIADAITDMKEYGKYKEQFDAMWNKALPYLEKAHELEPNDMSTMVSLRILYARLSMADKHKEILDKIKVIQGE
jgi:tetratricopeptide (TPR) repeat protein